MITVTHDEMFTTVIVKSPSEVPNVDGLLSPMDVVAGTKPPSPLTILKNLKGANGTINGAELLRTISKISKKGAGNSIGIKF